MKSGIHPEYVECTVTCGCGSTFVTRATTSTLNVEVCSVCHPFYTGKQKFVDRAGRVERFKRRHEWNESAIETTAGAKKSRRRKLEKVTIGVPKFKKAKEEEEEASPARRRGRREPAEGGTAAAPDAAAASGAGAAPDAAAAPGGDAPA